MTYESLEIGPGPDQERVAQKSSDPDFYQRNRAECRAFINQIRRQIGMEPEGATLYTKREPGGNGGYYEVAVKFEIGNQEATEYAFKIEGEAPEKWDNDAKRELGIASDPEELKLPRVSHKDVLSSGKRYLFYLHNNWWTSAALPGLDGIKRFNYYSTGTMGSIPCADVQYIYELPNATDLLQEVESERENRAMEDINKCETDT